MPADERHRAHFSVCARYAGASSKLLSRRIRDPDSEDPSRAVGVPIDQRRIVDQGLVGFDDISPDRAVNVACRFDGLDDSECFLGRDLGADLGGLRQRQYRSIQPGRDR